MRNPIEKATNIVQSAQRKSYLRSKGIDPQQEQLQLDMIFEKTMHPTSRFIPNDYARSAIFTVRNPSKPRGQMLNERIFHLDENVIIEYTGTELRAVDDEIVYLQLLYYASTRAPLGEPFVFTLKELVNDVGWRKSGPYYKKARECISRMKASEIKISKAAAFGKGLAQSLIGHYEFLNDGNGKAAMYKMVIPKDLIYLLAGNTFTNHNWRQFLSYSAITRRLADYARSHRQPWALKLEDFAAVCKTDCKTPGKWKQEVNEACDALSDDIKKQIKIVRSSIHFYVA